MSDIKEFHKTEALLQFKQTVKRLSSHILEHDRNCNIGKELKYIIEEELCSRKERQRPTPEKERGKP